MSFGVMLAMSLAGFYEGWRTGWACGKGRPLWEVMREGPTVTLLHRLLPRTLTNRFLAYLGSLRA